MTTDEALAFLRSRQPMPDAADLTADVADAYVAALAHFGAVRDPRCVPLLLGSFPDRPGVGMYTSVEDILRGFPAEDVVPHLERSLRSPLRGVRYWSAQIAADFPDRRLVAPLSDLLGDGDRDVRFFAAAALSGIAGDDVRRSLETHLTSESDEEIRKIVEDAIGR